MFTGIIAAIGTVAARQPCGQDIQLQIATRTLDMRDVQIGDSIAVNGVCLTVTALRNDGFWADVSRETLTCTLLGQAMPGMPVNLEKALLPTTRMGGHLVSGHVDGVGTVTDRHPDGRSWHIRIQAPDPLARYIAAKGAICIDGVSLTVNHVDGAAFTLNIIPQTLADTTLSQLQVRQHVHLEVDIIARYLERLWLGERAAQPHPHDRSGLGVTEALLRENGFWN